MENDFSVKPSLFLVLYKISWSLYAEVALVGFSLLFSIKHSSLHKDIIQVRISVFDYGVVWEMIFTWCLLSMMIRMSEIEFQTHIKIRNKRTPLQK